MDPMYPAEVGRAEDGPVEVGAKVCAGSAERLLGFEAS